MAEYHFKLDNDESTVGTVIKVLSMLQGKDYSASIDSDKHILTITTNEKDSHWKAVKKKLGKARRKLFWINVWKHFCNWWAQKGYWVTVLGWVPVLVLSCGGDIKSSIIVSIWIDVMVIIFSIS